MTKSIGAQYQGKKVRRVALSNTTTCAKERLNARDNTRRKAREKGKAFTFSLIFNKNGRVAHPFPKSFP
ncbi:hypothetical protein [Chloroherpeton thalassium]|uniref:hypothetical protein n=1 Tax=Chloroherpeton thalassium TaxID=100716 RepID=UPI0002E6877B|nr:hypothetical protein [Chloroherpeton thalassium]